MTPVESAIKQQNESKFLLYKYVRATPGVGNLFGMTWHFKCFWLTTVPTPFLFNFVVRNVYNKQVHH